MRADMEELAKHIKKLFFDVRVEVDGFNSKQDSLKKRFAGLLSDFEKWK